jgi:hypothetical protein
MPVINIKYLIFPFSFITCYVIMTATGIIVYNRISVINKINGRRIK